MPALKFPKSWLRTLGYRQKIHLFFFSHKWGTRFKYLSKLCPYILMYSALHIMQWFSQVLDVFTPKIKRPFFDFYILWIKTNVAYTRLEMIARTKYCTTTTASNWFVALYYKLLPAVRSSSKHGRWRSSLLLYSISMGYTCHQVMHLSFVSPASGYPGNSGALVVMQGEHVRGCSRGLMVIIWARNLSWDLIGDVQWYGGRNFVRDLASKTPYPVGKSADISGGRFVSF